MLITFWFIKCIKATTYTFLLCNNDNLNGMQCQTDILWWNFSKKYYDAVTRMAWVQTEKLALQMTVNFHGQLTRPAGWHPQPAGSLHHHHSTSYSQNTAQYYMHILYTVAMYLSLLLVYDFASTNCSLTWVENLSNFYLCKVGQK